MGETAQEDQAMPIVDIRESSVPISRFADPSVPSGGLTTSTVAVITDVTSDGNPVVGYGLRRSAGSHRVTSQYRFPVCWPESRYR